MFNKMIVNMVIAFVLRQLDKFKDEANWSQIEKDLEDRVRALVPGDWFDEDAVSIVNTVLTGIRHVLNDDAKLKQILQSLSIQDWSTAFNVLKTLVMAAWADNSLPSTGIAKDAMLT